MQLNKKLQQKFSVVDVDSDLIDTANKELNNTTYSNSNLNSDLNASGNLNAEATKKRKIKPESKLRFRKNFASLLDEEVSCLFV